MDAYFNEWSRVISPEYFGSFSLSSFPSPHSHHNLLLQFSLHSISSSSFTNSQISSLLFSLKLHKPNQTKPNHFSRFLLAAMSNSGNGRSSIMGNVTGLLADEDLYTQNELLVCLNVDTVGSKGIWLKDNPLDFPLPTLMAELVIHSILTRIVNFLLKPLKQGISSAQVIVRSFPL